jgi:hypothetical protein
MNSAAIEHHSLEPGTTLFINNTTTVCHFLVLRLIVSLSLSFSHLCLQPLVP